MTIEAVQYISDLNTSYPRSTDLLREGDDHIRMIKASLKKTFPNVNGAVQISSTALNDLNSQMQVSQAGLRLTKPFYVDGNSNIRDDLRAGALYSNSVVNAKTIELTDSTPVIDFHWNNSGGDYTARIIHNAADTLQISSSNSNVYLDIVGRINVRSNATIAGNLGVSGTISTGNRIAAPSAYFNNGVNPDQQGTFIGWNSSGRDGEGNIKVNRGSGVGGLKFEFINTSNTAVEGTILFDRLGNVTCQTINTANINANGSLGATLDIHANRNISANGTVSGGAIKSGGDVYAGGAHLGTDGNIYDSPAWLPQGNLKGWAVSNLLGTGGSTRITNWHWNDNSNIDFDVDGSANRHIETKSGSDEKFKENIKSVNSKIGYDSIVSIPLKSFKYKDFSGINSDTGESYTTIGKTYSVGFIAQDVENIIPEAIDDHVDGKYVDQFPLITNLIAAVQYLSKEVEELKAKLEA